MRGELRSAVDGLTLIDQFRDAAGMASVCAMAAFGELMTLHWIMRTQTAERRSEVDAATLLRAGWTLIDPDCAGERSWKPPIADCTGLVQALYAAEKERRAAELERDELRARLEGRPLPSADVAGPAADVVVDAGWEPPF